MLVVFFTKSHAFFLCVGTRTITKHDVCRVVITVPYVSQAVAIEVAKLNLIPIDGTITGCRVSERSRVRQGINYLTLIRTVYPREKVCKAVTISLYCVNVILSVEREFAACRLKSISC